MAHFEDTCIAVPDAPEIGERNPIHGEGAKAYGYRDGIVSGIVTYGWATRAFLKALGEGWLDHGWAEVQFRRPVYGEDVLTTRVDMGGAETGAFETRNADGEAVLRGRIGLGDGPWRDEFRLPSERDPLPPIEDPPVVDRDAIPVGTDYRPMAVDMNLDATLAWTRGRAHDEAPRYLESRAPRVHPSWVAGQITPLVCHSYRYVAGIHAASRVQHLRPVRAGGRITVAARWIDTYERKGKRYAVSDGVLVDERGRELVCVRQTSIFLPAVGGAGVG